MTILKEDFDKEYEKSKTKVTVEEYEKRRADAIKFAVGIGIALGSLITGIVAIV